MYSGHKIGAVVLAYKVEDYIKNVIECLPDFIDNIYVIEDGSPDRTAQVVQMLNHPQVRLLKHETNRGPGAALSTGYRAALQDGMDIMLKIDGDGQMPSSEIENLLTPIVQKKADYTKGDRLSNPEHCCNMPRFRLLGNRLLTGLTRIASGYWHLNDAQNGFTAISARVYDVIGPDLYPYYGYLNDLLVQLNVYNFTVVDVPMPARYGQEKSSIRLIPYLFKVSYLLLTRFIWRLWKKHVRRHGR